VCDFGLSVETPVTQYAAADVVDSLNSGFPLEVINAI
jgi:hypothetical protein